MDLTKRGMKMLKLEAALIQSKQSLLHKIIENWWVNIGKAFPLIVEYLRHEESWVVGAWQVQVGEP